MTQPRNRTLILTQSNVVEEQREPFLFDSCNSAWKIEPYGNDDDDDDLSRIDHMSPYNTSNELLLQHMINSIYDK